MGEWRYSSTIFYLGTRWRWLVIFTAQPLYPLRKSPQYQSDMRLCGPQSRFGHCGEKKNLTLPGNEPGSSNPEAVAILTELSRFIRCHISNLYQFDGKQMRSFSFFPVIITHSWRWDLLEKQPIVQVLKNFPTFYGTRRFITVFTRALHWSLSWARSISFFLPKIHFNIVHPPTSWSSQWSLSTWLPHQYPICIPALPPSCYIPCSSHTPWLDNSLLSFLAFLFPTLIGIPSLSS
jgi:hypothetical protein